MSVRRQSLADSLKKTPHPDGAVMIERIDDQIVLLEWVLNEPTGKYHA